MTVRAEVKFNPECADIFTSETVRKIHDKKMLVFKFFLANKYLGIYFERDVFESSQSTFLKNELISFKCWSRSTLS